jgi:probable rRNA maturation factor
MIYFTSELPTFKVKNVRKLKKWLSEVAKREHFSIDELTYIFLDDEALLEMNVSYLNHDTLTDIITFDNSEPETPYIEGDIFISIERVNENATLFNVPFEQELRRVLSHGLLHLCGYKDKTKEEEKLMRQKEEEALQLFEELL